MTAGSLDEPGRARVRDAIGAAEAKTAGEIFVVVARASGTYRSVPILWATLIALILPAPLILLTSLPVIDIWTIQVAAFGLLAAILSFPAIRMKLVPGPLGRARARALAHEQFLGRGLHTTEARTGVLVFVSLAEHAAEIVADSGIAGKVTQDVWDASMAKLLAEIRAGRLADGLIAAVADAGEVLARHFPPPAPNRDELPNEPILL